MRWNKGYSAEYYAEIVDPNTWRDIRRFEIISGSVKAQDSGTRIAADFICKDFDNKTEPWVRIYLVARQGAEIQRIPLFTGLATSPDSDINGDQIEYPVQCYSPLKTADDIYLQRGWYVPAGTDAGMMMKRLLSVTPAPIEISGEPPLLKESIVAEDDETNLTMVEKILKAIDWRLKVRGDGTIEIAPKATTAIKLFSAIENDCIEPDITLSNDWYACPNVFRAMREDMVAVSRDESGSIFSIENRGREVWAQETNVELSEGENLAQYARRRLKEVQMVKTPISYARRFDPEVSVTDIIRLNYREQGVQGLFRVEAQSIDLTHGARVQEEAINV